jgi:C4-dicarboxylate-specific signal transduction histidine kinase
VEHGSTSGRPTTDVVERTDDASERDDLTVRVGPLDDRTGFFVEDDGPGIPRDERDHVFDEGYSTGENGSGLGLSIVANVVDAHGWRIDVTGGRAGGARFEIVTEEIAGTARQSSLRSAEASD